MESAGIRAAASVLGKALSPLSDGVLETWGASSMLGSNMKALKLELLEAQAVLDNVQGMEIHNANGGATWGRTWAIAPPAKTKFFYYPYMYCTQPTTRRPIYQLLPSLRGDKRIQPATQIDFPFDLPPATADA